MEYIKIIAIKMKTIVLKQVMKDNGHQNLKVSLDLEHFQYKTVIDIFLQFLNQSYIYKKN